MTQFSEVLKNIRENKGFKSARAFYLDLESKAKLDFNYSYYMRIEGGKVLPSSDLVQNLCKLLDPGDSNRLVVAFCASLFPQQRILFSKLEQSLTPTPSHFQEPPTQSKRRELTEKQAFTIGKSQSHYYVFLLLSLARRPVHLKDLESRLKLPQVQGAIQDLKNEKLIFEEAGLISSSSSDLAFPQADGSKLKDLYRQLDRWDRAFADEMNFTDHRDKMMLRRISGRFASLIATHCDLIIDLIRSSEDVNTDVMDEVVYFQLTLSSGKVPG